MMAPAGADTESLGPTAVIRPLATTTVMPGLAGAPVMSITVT
jgi:hypothetical protein